MSCEFFPTPHSIKSNEVRMDFMNGQEVRVSEKPVGFFDTRKHILQYEKQQTVLALKSPEIRSPYI